MDLRTAEMNRMGKMERGMDEWTIDGEIMRGRWTLRG